jgi:hypothetical protein
MSFPSEQKKMVRFRRLDTAHISAIESLYRSYPFLRDRMEVHMPYHRAKPTFQSSTVWVWPKVDKRPVGFLIFMEGFSPCIWYPDRQEGMTLRWLLPPLLLEKGPTICLANLLTGESILQVEDILVYQGKDVWSSQPFSARWEILREFWGALPPEQPLLAITPRIVTPIALEDWSLHYDFAIYWIIQPDHSRQSRWYWKDVVTTHSHASVSYVAPQLKRSTEVVSLLCAMCAPSSKGLLPDIYTLTSQEGISLGLGAISTLELSRSLRELFTDKQEHPVEVRWNDTFKKYQMVRILPAETPVTTNSFFHHLHSTAT